MVTAGAGGQTIGTRLRWVRAGEQRLCPVGYILTRRLALSLCCRALDVPSESWRVGVVPPNAIDQVSLLALG